MLNFNSILLFSENPKELADFYKKVFQKDPDFEMEGYHGFSFGNNMIMIGPHDKVQGKNTTPERLIINFETPEVESEFTRIKELGATVVAEPYHPGEEPNMWLATFADPDGNFFQLGSPMEDPNEGKN
jgi:predicted enzyme related to lactoylglutathione lyase